MADHNKPTVTSNYLDFVNEMHGRMDDLAVGLDPKRTSATNVPDYSIRWSDDAKKWQVFSGSSWSDLASEYAINISGTAQKLKTPRTISITGGGTAQPVQFDGSANVQLTLESLDLANLTGLGSAAEVDVGTASDELRTNQQNDSRFIQGGSVVQETGSSTTNVMSQKAVTDALNNIIVAPIGMCYTQYPGTDTPSTLFGGTWTLMFNTEGVFFRTEGQGASSFGSGVQGDAIRNITGGTGSQIVGHASNDGSWGAFSVSISSNGAADGSTARTYRSYLFDASSVVPTASENRPRNRTIRVWRKTAH